MQTGDALRVLVVDLRLKVPKRQRRHQRATSSDNHHVHRRDEHARWRGGSDASCKHAVLEMHYRGSLGVEEIRPDEGKHATGHDRRKGVGRDVNAKCGRSPVTVERRVRNEHEERPQDSVIVALVARRVVRVLTRSLSGHHNRAAESERCTENVGGVQTASVIHAPAVINTQELVAAVGCHVHDNNNEHLKWIDFAEDSTIRHHDGDHTVLPLDEI
mmetsp:Transcript_9785/g.23257  ORF Transcript_9785/g.23257 Transcript_9785/m.23257 type:complete len:216 (-) Transcript_9785:713-1360(-)